MKVDLKRVPVVFYRAKVEREPVREWLKELDDRDRGVIGQDLKTLEFGWPIGMPLCKALSKGFWEIRSRLPQNRIARVIFCIHAQQLVVLHGFIKKTPKILARDLELARQRQKEIEHEKEK